MKKAVAAFGLFWTTPLLLACTVNSYAGIPFDSGAADPELQDLARRAWVGEQQAQLELGIRFEEGRGVRQDLRRARRLYSAAASGGGGTRMAYSPAAGRSDRTATIALSSGPEFTGLPAAQARLQGLNARHSPSTAEAALSFGSEELAALTRRFGFATRHSGLTVYPGAAPRRCWAGSRRPPLGDLLRDEMNSPAVVMPLGCLFSAYRPEELRDAAKRGDPRAQFIYASLLTEINGCSDSAHAATLERMSDGGYAPASIAIGNFLVRCGKRALGVERYFLAEQQGFINARGYYRGLELTLPPPGN